MQSQKKFQKRIPKAENFMKTETCKKLLAPDAFGKPLI
jgi:hypothetical protein